MRTTFPIALCLVMGLVMLAQFFVPHAYSQELFRRVVSGLLVIGVFGLVLGIGGLIHLHIQRVRRRAANWPYSVVALVGLVGMAGIGLVEGTLYPIQRLERSLVQPYDEGAYVTQKGSVELRSAELAGGSVEATDRVRIALPGGKTTEAKVVKFVRDADDKNEDGSLRVSVGRWNRGAPSATGTGFAVVRPGAVAFNWLFDYIEVPLDATMFSLLAFFIASAAFRAFRARNVGATLLLLAACVVILGLTPPFLAIWSKVFSAFPGFPMTAKDWILNVPNMAMRRAIFLGVGLGAVAQSFRVIFGIERTYLGGGG